MSPSSSVALHWFGRAVHFNESLVKSWVELQFDKGTGCMPQNAKLCRLLQMEQLQRNMVHARVLRWLLRHLNRRLLHRERLRRERMPCDRAMLHENGRGLSVAARERCCCSDMHSYTNCIPDGYKACQEEDCSGLCPTDAACYASGCVEGCKLLNGTCIPFGY